MKIDRDLILDNPITQVFGFGGIPLPAVSIPYTGEAGGGFTVGDAVLGVTSTATGTVVAIKSNGAANTGTVFLTPGSGTFQNAEALSVGGTTRGTSSAGPTTLTGSDVTHAGIYYRATAPNGVLPAPQGSICIVAELAQLHINTDGGTTWANVGP